MRPFSRVFLVVSLFCNFLFSTLPATALDTTGSTLGQEARDLLQKAFESEKKKDLHQAVALYEQALEADSRILAFHDRGLVQLLIIKYQDLALSERKNPEILFKLAHYSAVAQFDVEKAHFYFEELKRQFPESEEAKKANDILATLNEMVTSLKAELAREQLRIRAAASENEKIVREEEARRRTGKKIAETEESAEEKRDELQSKKERVAQLEEELNRKKELRDYYYRNTYVRPEDTPYDKETNQQRYFRYRRELTDLENNLKKAREDLENSK